MLRQPLPLLGADVSRSVKEARCAWPHLMDDVFTCPKTALRRVDAVDKSPSR